MNNSPSAVKEMTKLINLLERWNYEYFVLNSPGVEDKVYDQTLKELKELETKHNFVLPNSPTQKIGVKVKKKFHPTKHQIPMLSLDSTDNYEELEKFDQRVKKKLKSAELEYLCELKIDGLSVSLIYQQGQLKQIITRGDGWTGENVTINKSLIQDIPLSLGERIDCEIRGEVYMKREEFQQLNEELKKEKLPLLANPRNAAAGTLRTLIPLQKRNLHFFAYQIFGIEEINKQEICLQKLSQLGFSIDFHYRLCKDLEEVKVYFQEIKSLRNELDFEIDGIVIKVNDYAYHSLLGKTSKFPRWALAYKFPASIAISQVKNILTEVTRSGRISYVAEIEPILLQGSKINKVTLHNYKFIQQLKLNIGDKVVIKKAGDIIPQAIQIIKLTDKNTHWSSVTNCPSCDSCLMWNKEKIYQICLNDDCPEKNIKSLALFAAKSGMDIKGISEAIIRKLYQAKLLNKPSDFYYLVNKKKELSQLEGLQEKSIGNLFNNIEKSKKRPFFRLLIALGIPLLGQFKCQKLVSLCPNLVSFLEIIEKNDLALVGNQLGIETQKEMEKFFQKPKNLQILKELTKIDFVFE